MAEQDALAFEYQRDNRMAVGDLDIADIINNPTANGVCSVFGLGFQEEFPDIVRIETSPLRDDGDLAALIAKAAKPLRQSDS